MIHSAPSFSAAQLTGRDAEGLVDAGDGALLLPAVAQAFERLASDARAAGFDLRIASAHRSFERQLVIFNGKAAGTRPVLDDRDEPVNVDALDLDARIQAILRFSALPGASRHHWGTDLDVFDAAALPVDYRLELSQREVAPGGLFDALHCWLDARIASDASHGFYRPYDRDRGGVAPERWHLSYAPLAAICQERVDVELLRACWAEPCARELCWREELDVRLPSLVRRYLQRVAPPPA